jgi:hypothetical protein
MIISDSFVILHNAVVSGDSSSTAVDVSQFTGPVTFRLYGIPTEGDAQTCSIKLQQGATASTATTDVSGGAFTALADSASGQSLTLGKGVLGKYVRLNFDIGGNNSPAYAIVCEAVGRLTRNPAS